MNLLLVDTLMTSHPHEWAILVVMNHGVATTGPAGTNDDVTRGFTNLGASLNRFADKMKTSNEIMTTKVEKEAKTLNTGKEKLIDFILKMICNALEPI